MSNKINLHADIRSFNKDADGTFIDISNTVLSYPKLEQCIIPGKAPLATSISTHLHKFLQEMGVNTHFLMQIEKQKIKVLQTEQLPFEIVIRNVATEDLVTEFGIDKDKRFHDPLVEYYIRSKENDRNPIRVSESHLLAFEVLEDFMLTEINEIALRVNDAISGVFFGIGAQLVDIKLEFGIPDDDENDFDKEPIIMLTSELSPDVLTLIDLETKTSLDSSLAFCDNNNALSGYLEVIRRLKINRTTK